MYSSSFRILTAFWTCVSLSWFTWLALPSAQADAGDFIWPWLCDAVTEHYDRLKQERGPRGPRNVIGYHTIVGNFSYVRIHDKLYDSSCGEPSLLRRFSFGSGEL